MFETEKFTGLENMEKEIEEEIRKDENDPKENMDGKGDSDFPGQDTREHHVSTWAEDLRDLIIGVIGSLRRSIPKGRMKIFFRICLVMAIYEAFASKPGKVLFAIGSIFLLLEAGRKEA